MSNRPPRQQRFAALIYFKKDVSRKAAERAVERIRHVLEQPKLHSETRGGQYHQLNPPQPQPYGTLVQGYNPAHGSPVWYIP